MAFDESSSVSAAAPPTNDAGAGLLQSLGVRLLDANGDELGRGGAALADVSVIDITTMDPAIGNVSIIAACDVTNPLTGPTGASAVFGPQKGAGADDVATLDAALAHFARLIESRFGVDVSDVPGAGVAGGIGAVFGIAPGASSLNDLLADAAANVTRTTEQIVRVLRMK